MMAVNLEKAKTKDGRRDEVTTSSVHNPGSDSPSKSSVDNISAVPDGGTLAWLQVLGAFFLFFNTFGLINTFGVYQTYYDLGELFTASPAAISWVGSAQGFLLQFLGPLSGPLYDAGYFRPLTMAGAFLLVFGQMTLSLCNSYYQVLLAQAICMGVGAGLLWLPCVALLSQYFDKKLATATGIAASGSGLGGIFFPITFYRLLPRIGFAWATRVLGFIALGTLTISVSIMKPRVVPKHRRRLLDLAAFKEGPYSLFTAGCFFAWLGLYGPYFYVDSFSISYQLSNDELSFYTLAVINTGSVFGRLVPNYLADQTGPMSMIAPACILAGVLAVCLIPVRQFAPLIVVSALYGFFSGALTSLFSTVYIRLSAHKRALIGTRMGMGLLTTSFALLLGTPISGWILAASSYTHVWIFSGLMLLVGGFLMLLARIMKANWKLFAKV